MRKTDPASVFGSLPFGESQSRLSSLARSDAESLLERANYVAPGRYRSLFQTHLETAMMFLNKAIAFDGVTEHPVPCDKQAPDSLPISAQQRFHFNQPDEEKNSD